MENNTVLRTAPAVFAVGKKYQIFVPVSCQTIMWINVGGEKYYDHSNGILRSAVSVHRIEVPMEALDAAKKYTVCYRVVIERKPYFPEFEEEVQLDFDFRPVSGENLRAYHIADAHNLLEEPVSAAHAYVKEVGPIDFLVLNGDIPNHSGRVEKFDTIYEISSRITGGNIPIVFARGNHDMRGLCAENFAEYTPCQNGKTYYTFRLGKVWGLVLDCGEDKVDEHPEYGGTLCCHQFRKEETAFIDEVVKRAEEEYAADDVLYKLVICHMPFTRKLKEPFGIEEDIYRYWTKQLREHIKPDVMMAGHLHYTCIYQPGCECDHYGQAWPVVVGSAPGLGKDNTFYIGSGFTFSKEGIDVSFTESSGTLRDTTRL